MPDSASDLACFFNAADGFTTSATIGETEVTCHLDEGYEEEVEVEGYRPEIHVLVSQLSSQPADGTAVVIGNRNFKVRNVRPDIAQKVWIIQLEFVSES
jgi:hypothetical protein